MVICDTGSRPEWCTDRAVPVSAVEPRPIDPEGTENLRPTALIFVLADLLCKVQMRKSCARFYLNM